MNRRGFITGLAGILASASAPSIVRASSLMRVRPIVLLGEDVFEDVWAKIDAQFFVEFDKALFKVWQAFVIKPEAVLITPDVARRYCRGLPTPGGAGSIPAGVARW